MVAGGRPPSLKLFGFTTGQVDRTGTWAEQSEACRIMFCSGRVSLFGGSGSLEGERKQMAGRAISAAASSPLKRRVVLDSDGSPVPEAPGLVHCNVVQQKKR